MSPVDEKLNEFARQNNIAGYAIQLIDQRNLSDLFVSGLRDASTQEPITEKTQFQAASISKTVAATLALVVAKKQRISLDEDINPLLGRWKLRTKTPVTLRQLLSHSGGITVSSFQGYTMTAPVPTIPAILNGKPPANSRKVFQRYSARNYHYSGGGFVIVQYLLEQLTDYDFEALARKHVFKPLQMKYSTFELKSLDEENVALGHTTKGRVLRGGWRNHPESAAAGLWTTSSDIGRLVIELLNADKGKGKVLTHEQAKQMLTPYNRGGAGLGVFVYAGTVPRQYGHSGSNVGYRCCYRFSMNGNGVSIMTNSTNGFAFIDKARSSLDAIVPLA